MKRVIQKKKWIEPYQKIQKWVTVVDTSQSHKKKMKKGYVMLSAFSSR